jgi:hypothetical protein
MKRQNVALWTVRSGHIDGIRPFIEGERAHDEANARSRPPARACNAARRKASRSGRAARLPG